MSRLTRLSEWLLKQPLVWGGLGSLAFYALVVPQAEAGSLIAGAFTGSGWEFKAAACLACFTGLASLVMRLLGVVVQFGSLQRDALPPMSIEGESVDSVDELLAELDAAPRAFEATYLGKRLRRTLELVRQRGSADQLEFDLARLADDDRRSMADRYATVRMMMIAIGLVGVTGATGSLAIALAGVAGQSLEVAMPVILGGLGVACAAVMQTSALTLVLLVSRLAVQRVEQRLLEAVDAYANRALLGRFARLRCGEGSAPRVDPADEREAAGHGGVGGRTARRGDRQVAGRCHAPLGGHGRDR